MKNFLFILFGVFVVAGAFAAGENVPTSKGYVDAAVATKQDIIPANDGTTQVLTNTGTAGEYDTKGIYDANGEYATQQNNLVDAATMNAGVQNAINSEFQCVEWDEHGECLLLNIGSAAMFSSGYTQLEYLESTGTQWINTSIIPDTNIRIVTSFVMPANPRTNFGWVLGSRTSNFSIGIHVYTNYFANQIRFDFKSTDTAICSATESLVNKAVVVDFNDNFNAFVYDENNNLLCSAPLRNPGNAQSTEPLAIFGYKKTTENTAVLPVKIFYVRIYNGSMLVHNFIPARRNSDGVLGMYDTVSNTFFTNAGTGEFIAGPIVYLPNGQ